MSETKEIKKVNAIFNKQIIKNEYAILDKKLFNLSNRLSIEDWKNIRVAEFWEYMDNLRNNPKLLAEFRDKESVNEGSGHGYFWWKLEILKKQYTLLKVNQYIRQ